MQLKEIIQTLILRKETLSLAESCTGGLLAHTLTNIPGSSGFFLLGIVAYDNAAKSKLLRISSSTLRKHGAVSLAVAEKMAKNVQKIIPTTYGIGITGIAGPGGGSKTKPVGLTFISVSNGRKTISQEFHFKGSRLQNKTQAARAALRILAELLAK